MPSILQAAVAQPADWVLAVQQGLHEGQVLRQKEVDAPMRLSTSVKHPGDDVSQVMALLGTIRPLADEGQITTVDRVHGLTQGRQTIKSLP